MKLSDKQKVQEGQYELPYHYAGLFSELHKAIGEVEYLSECNAIKKHLAPYKGQLILDAGCGDGRFCYEMLGLDARIVGVDYSERAISFAKAFNPGIEFFVQDLTLLDLPYRFDQIILNEVIEHIPPEMLPEIIRRIAAHLKDEGMLVVSVPSANKPVSAKHYQHFTPESLEKTLRPYFSITSLECYGRSGKEKRLSLLKKIVMVSFPFRKKIAPVRKLVEYLPKYYEKNMAHAGPKDCKGLIAVCRKNK